MKFPIVGGAILVLSGLAALVAVSMSGRGPEPAEPAVTAIPGTSAVVFSVPDMSCEFACAPAVRETLAAIPGVENVETDVEAHTATVVTGDGFDEAQAIAALTKAGFPAERAAN